MPGHLEKRSKSSWTIVIEAGRDPVTGKRKRIKVAFRGTKRQAEREMHRLLHELESGTYVEPSSMTVGEYLLWWLEHYARPSTAPRTFESYEMIVRRHLIPALGALALQKLQPVHIQAYYSQALQSLSPRTVAYHHAVLHEALRHAVRWQLIRANPADAVKRPQYRRPAPVVLDDEGARSLLRAAKGHQDYALILTALFTGMRQGELLGLRWEDVDLEGGVIQIRQALQRVKGQGYVFREPKTEAGRRSVAISPQVVAVLRRLKKEQAAARLLLGPAYEDHGLVFCRPDGRPINATTLTKRFRRLAEAAGFPGLRFHDLRHTHATLLLARGVHPKIVQERLGHEDVTLTLNTYSHVLPGLQAEAAKKLDDALKDDAIK